MFYSRQTSRQVAKNSNLEFRPSMVPPDQQPGGPPVPPGMPPPEVLRNLPPELMNILRHIPPPSISSNDLVIGL